MSAHRVQMPQIAFMLSRGIKRAREQAHDHLRFVHGLPCLVCGAPGECAHIRMGNMLRGKPPTGKSEKPSDKWVVPLCPDHHRNGPDAQHNMNEAEWWARQGIDPIATAALLWTVTGDQAAAELICANPISTERRMKP